MTEIPPRASRSRLGRKARLRLAGATVAVFALGFSLATGGVPGVGAIFTADVENQGAVAAGGWIPAPSSPSDSVGGAANDERNLGWTSGASASSPSPNPVTGQTILAADGGSGSSASCGGYSTLTTVAANATTYPDTAGTAADWWCYQAVSTSSGSWTSDAVTFAPIRLLVPTQVVIANGGTGTRVMNSGDTITITFNQNINTPAANHFCAVNGTPDVLLLGDTRTSGTCNSGDTYVIGKLSGGSIGSTHLLTETDSVAANVLTVKLTANTTATATGTWTFTASGSITATAGTAACTAANCTVTASGSF